MRELPFTVLGRQILLVGRRLASALQDFVRFGGQTRFSEVSFLRRHCGKLPRGTLENSHCVGVPRCRYSVVVVGRRCSLVVGHSSVQRPRPSKNPRANVLQGAPCVHYRPLDTLAICPVAALLQGELKNREKQGSPTADRPNDDDRVRTPSAASNPVWRIPSKERERIADGGSASGTCACSGEPLQASRPST